jgi:DNA invertase Pin-like site-specific DNA recombinase
VVCYISFIEGRWIGKNMAKGKFVAYYRVSTRRQGVSGLGLEAQQKAVRDYLDGGRWQLVEEVIEVESGKRDDRPQLARALDLCRAWRATLVIAKLDRLARNVEFTARLMNSGVEFVAVDFPQANRLTIHILAAMAEHEREMISARTKAALAAAKARGVKLGGDRGGLNDKARRAGNAGSAKVRGRMASERASSLLPVLGRLKSQGVKSAQALARALNEEGVPTVSGTGRWQANSVQRVLRRAQV